MKIKNWVIGLINQLVSWFTRRRNLGVALLSSSSLVLLGIAGGFSFKVQDIAGVVKAFEFSTGDGLPDYLVPLVICLAAITWLIGLVIVIRSYLHEEKEADVRRILVVEMRGLIDTSDKPLIKAVPANIVGRRVDCLVDVRPLLTGNSPNVVEALKEIEHIQRDVRRARGDTGRENVQVIAGGVMQVPLLFYAGTLLDDEGNTMLFDWERTKGDWKQLNEADDESRFIVNGLENFNLASEVVVAVSASYKAALDEIDVTFPGIPVVHLARQNPQPNTLWSEDTQAALTQQFIETLATLANHGIKMVHLVLAAPATLCIRFGKAYDHRNMPKLRCYQRESEHTLPYPWSVEMPAATQPVTYLTTQTTSTQIR